MRTRYRSRLGPGRPETWPSRRARGALRPMRRSVPRVASVLALSGLFCAAVEPVAEAREAVFVKVGEVSANAPDDAKLMRSSLEAALVGQSTKSAKKRVVLSASLLACDERACVISATLREETGGKVLAVVRGKASSSAPVAREGLLRTAAEGAAKQVPRAFE